MFYRVTAPPLDPTNGNGLRRYADMTAEKGDLLTYVNLLQNVDFVINGGVVYKEDSRLAEDNLR